MLLTISFSFNLDQNPGLKKKGNESVEFSPCAPCPLVLDEPGLIVRFRVLSIYISDPGHKLTCVYGAYLSYFPCFLEPLQADILLSQLPESLIQTESRGKNDDYETM